MAETRELVIVFNLFLHIGRKRRSIKVYTSSAHISDYSSKTLYGLSNCILIILVIPIFAGWHARSVA